MSGSFSGFLRNEMRGREGDRVALMLPNVLAYPVAFLGTLRAGLIVVNVNPLYTPRELEHQLNDSGATTIVIMENFAHKLTRVIANTSVEHVVVARLGDLTSPPRRWLLNFINSFLRRAVPPWKFERFTMLQDACCCATRPAFDEANSGPAALALLQYTGGTTGLPKGAVLSHRNLVANTLQCRAWIGTRLDLGTERVLTPLPLYHIFALTANLLTFASLGALNVLVPDPRDLSRLIATMRRARVTTMSGVNTLFGATLVNRPDFAKLDFRALRFAIGGGAAIQQAVAARWQEVTRTPLVEGYGLTEASWWSASISWRRRGSAALGFPFLRLRSASVTMRGRAVAIGEPGEVWVRGPQVMQGYWGRPEETKKVLTDDGWLQTGDVGTMDAKGFVSLLDRKKDMIIVSGFKVYPNEVEDLVLLHPGLLEAGVIGVPDERTEQAVKLFVVRRDPSLTMATIREHCRENLTGYKVPKRIEFRHQLPKTPIGKILRRELQLDA
jgi:long-chain acyl-CoA synthetase